MNLATSDFDHLYDFRQKTTLWIANIILVFLTPFAIYNIIQERYLLGAGSFVIVALLFAIAYSIKQKRYYLLLTHILVVFIIFFQMFSIYSQGIIGIFWVYPALISFYFMLPERQAWIANFFLFITVYPLAYHMIELVWFMRLLATTLVVSAFTVIFIRIITQYQDVVKRHAITDHLTGTLNRTMLQSVLDFAVEQNKRLNTPIALLALDIDHFKKINDTYGHNVGDRVLRDFSDLLMTRFRSIDRVFRLGGEEFLVLLYSAGEEAAIQLAREICSTIASTEFIKDHPITVSIGVASLQVDEKWQDWIKRSDDNLYQAKSNGRNCVFC